MYQLPRLDAAELLFTHRIMSSELAELSSGRSQAEGQHVNLSLYRLSNGALVGALTANDRIVTSLGALAQRYLAGYVAQARPSVGASTLDAVGERTLAELSGTSWGIAEDVGGVQRQYGGWMFAGQPFIRSVWAYVGNALVSIFSTGRSEFAARVARPYLTTFIRSDGSVAACHFAKQMYYGLQADELADDAGIIPRGSRVDFEKTLDNLLSPAPTLSFVPQ